MNAGTSTLPKDHPIFLWSGAKNLMLMAKIYFKPGWQIAGWVGIWNIFV